MDEIQLDTISWSAPEYSHKGERSNDWYWTIGVITIISCIIAIWLGNYVFSIFLFVAGGCLIMFTMRTPMEVTYTIETKGLSMGKDLYTWKKLKSFNIQKVEDDVNHKLLIETSKYFLPIYTIPLPKELEAQVKENLLKIIPRSEIHESPSMVFMEKIGY